MDFLKLDKSHFSSVIRSKNKILLRPTKSTAELGGHGHELNGHRCPCPRHGHGRGMDTKFLEKRGVDMDMAMKKSVKRGVDMDMATKNP